MRHHLKWMQKTWISLIENGTVGEHVELMKHQCETGLKLLKEKKIDGMVFEANTTMGVRLPSELWVREWLETAKYTEIPD